MAEERRPRTISTMPRLSADDIANRAFATSFRGYAEAEVRSFLKRVSEELVGVREREHELLSAIDELEARLAAPRPLDEKELLDALGEETARLLRNAREAAEDIRHKSEERAARLAEESQSEAQRLRHEAAEILAVRSREAEEAAAEIQRRAEERVAGLRDEAERIAEEARLRAQSEADGIVEGARRQGRDMVEEAKALRERVLKDLGRRRTLLQAQLEELRNGRDHLLDAYRTVKRTFLEATEALAQAEARAAAGKPIASVEAAAAAAADDESLGEDELDAGDAAGVEPPAGEDRTEALDVESIIAGTDVEPAEETAAAEAVDETAAVSDEASQEVPVPPAPEGGEQPSARPASPMSTRSSLAFGRAPKPKWRPRPASPPRPMASPRWPARPRSRATIHPGPRPGRTRKRNPTHRPKASPAPNRPIPRPKPARNGAPTRPHRPTRSLPRWSARPSAAPKTSRTRSSTRCGATRGGPPRSR